MIRLPSSPLLATPGGGLSPRWGGAGGGLRPLWGWFYQHGGSPPQTANACVPTGVPTGILTQPLQHTAHPPNGRLEGLIGRLLDPPPAQWVRSHGPGAVVSNPASLSTSPDDHRGQSSSGKRDTAVGDSFYTVPPPPPCISYALVQATVGVGTVLIWDLILIRYQT